MKQSIIILIILLITPLCFSQSPHGKGFKLNCALCHDANGWAVKRDKITFNHKKTGFPLVGQHQSVDCRRCHADLVFSKAKSDCSSCHADVHQQTVGRDCDRCHTPNSWLVTKIKQVHQQAGFVLVGAHASADCNSCHQTSSQLRFDKMNKDCYSCHKAKYESTTNPKHAQSGFSTDCFRCHNMVGRDWTVNGKGFEHGFLPLVGGHAIDCSKCHDVQNYKLNTNTDCQSCHSHVADYARAKSVLPAHSSKIAKYSCTTCHNSNSWNNVRFKQHDSRFFKIYSGEHKGKWDRCTDCHNNDTEYRANCKKCHD